MPIKQLPDGQYFDLLHPDASGLTLDTIARGLAKIARFDGATRYHYSVAQHSLWVASRVPDQYKWDALMHDAHEVITGDITQPMKEACPALAALEASIASVVREHFGVSDPEPEIVKQADLEALAFERRELMPADLHPWPVIEHIDCNNLPGPYHLPLDPAGIEELFFQKAMTMAPSLPAAPLSVPSRVVLAGRPVRLHAELISDMYTTMRRILGQDQAQMMLDTHYRGLSDPADDQIDRLTQPV